MINLVRVFGFLTRIQVKIRTSPPKASLSYTPIYHLHHHTNTVTQLSDHSEDILRQNKTLFCYINNGRLNQAEKMFDEMPLKDAVSWNTMLSGYRSAKSPERVYIRFVRMLRSGLSPTGHTISIVIVAVLGDHFKALVPQLHALAVRSALSSDLFVGSALIRGYADLGDALALKKTFDDVYEKNVSTWNALVSGYARLGLPDDARRAFDEMGEGKKNVVTWTGMIGGYIAADRIDEARQLFDEMGERRNVVTWTTMIGGHVHARGYLEALGLFAAMMSSSSATVRPNGFTFSAALAACAGLCSLVSGRQVHSVVWKWAGPDVVLSSSIVDMYAKCGDMGAATRAFEEIGEKSVVTWNAVIGGYARHGMGERAIRELERMVRGGVGPDGVTLLNVLAGCAHGGLVREAEEIFSAMEEQHGVRAGREHYGCMVDMYAKGCEVEKALDLVRDMDLQPDALVWGAMLAGKLAEKKKSLSLEITKNNN